MSNEQARSRGLSSEVARLSQKLEEAEAKLKAASESLNQSQQRIDSLSQCLRKSDSQVENTSSEVEAMSFSDPDFSKKMPISLAPKDRSLEAGKGRDLSMIPDDATGETERLLRERLIGLEREVCICE